MKEQLIYIKRIREKNNELWMKLIEVALTKAPEETKNILKQIRVNDLLISETTGELIDENSKPKN